jgi:PEP-CTERM motif
MIKHCLAGLTAVALFGLSGVSHAAVQPTESAQLIFHDNFDNNVSGRNTPPINWTVTNGTVDVVGNGDQDYLPGNGLYVDLDGTSNSAGELRTSLELNADVTYIATYQLAGSQRGDLAPLFGASRTDIVDVYFGSSLLSHTLDANDPIQTFSMSFSPTTSGLYELMFHNQGGDLIGAILTEVTVATIPEPATTTSMLLGLVALTAALRKRQRSQKL